MNINLYPWRFENNKTNNRRFYLFLFMANFAGVVFFIVFISIIRGYNVKLEMSILQLMNEKNALLIEKNDRCLTANNAHSDADADSGNVFAENIFDKECHSLVQANKFSNNIQEKLKFIKNNFQYKFESSTVLLKLAGVNHGNISIAKIKFDKKSLRIFGVAVSALAITKFIDDIERSLAWLNLQKLEINYDKKKSKQAINSKLIIFNLIFVNNKLA